MPVTTRIDLVIAAFGVLFFIGNRFSRKPRRTSLVWNSPPRYVRLLLGGTPSQLTYETLLRSVGSAALAIIGLGSAAWGQAAGDAGFPRTFLTVIGLVFLGSTAVGVAITVLRSRWFA